MNSLYSIILGVARTPPSQLMFSYLFALLFIVTYLVCFPVLRSLDGPVFFFSSFLIPPADTDATQLLWLLVVCHTFLDFGFCGNIFLLGSVVNVVHGFWFCYLVVVFSCGDFQTCAATTGSRGIYIYYVL